MERAPDLVSKRPAGWERGLFLMHLAGNKDRQTFSVATNDWQSKKLCRPFVRADLSALGDKVARFSGSVTH